MPALVKHVHMLAPPSLILHYACTISACECEPHDYTPTSNPVKGHGKLFLSFEKYCVRTLLKAFPCWMNFWWDTLMLYRIIQIHRIEWTSDVATLCYSAPWETPCTCKFIHCKWLLLARAAWLSFMLSNSNSQKVCRVFCTLWPGFSILWHVLVCPTEQPQQ